MKSIALIGFMGSGKSTVGPLLAQKIGLEFIDLDTAAAEAAGMSISDIFAGEGESGWRRRESAALLGVAKLAPLVVACGGGIILTPENITLLKRYFLTVYLKASEEALIKRLSRSVGRPLLDLPDPAAEIKRLFRARADAYESAADLTISADAGQPDEVADRAALMVQEALRD
jgi:shikimate kinase